MKNFVLIGAAGYIAPRHMKAIRDTGNNLLAIYDPNDSVGIIDSYFPKADYFKEFERFDRHIEKLKRQGIQIHYVSICSPNYLHDAHIRFGLRIGADVICEKPIVLNPWNIDALQEVEKETKKTIFPILQLRHHPSIISLKEQVQSEKDKFYHIQLKYITARGNWYQHSWKGNIEKSGGIATNIGIHFFDALIWIFGEVKGFKTLVHGNITSSGNLLLERASIDWELSIDEERLPSNIILKGQRTFRSILIDNKEIEFSDGFNDLHSISYKEILEGRGYGISNTRESIELASKIRRNGE